MSTEANSTLKTRSESQSESDFSRWKRDATIAAWSGGGAALLMAVGALVLGNFGTSESRFMVESIIPTSRTLCSSIVTASATILALMLTVLSLTTGSKVSLDALFYKRIKQIAFYDMLALAFSISFLVLLCVPITESEEIPEWWYPTVYYVMLDMSAILGGAMIAIVAMLYTALRNLIDVFGLNQEEHSLRRESGESNKENANGKA